MKRLLKITVPFVTFAISLASNAQAAKRVLIDDSLTGTTKGQLFEGELTEEGYAPRSREGHILYQPPYWPSRCTITFEVKGVKPGTGDPDWDSAFLGAYDGRGITEPARYFYEFRENFFRYNLHWRGDRHRIKCVINCAEDTAERRNSDVGYFDHPNGEERDWSVEPNGSPVDWDPTKWYAFRIVWTPTRVSVDIDNEEVWSADLMPNHPYKPVVPRIWIGSAPHNGPKYANHYPEILYRNFKMVDNNYTLPAQYSLWTSENNLSGEDALPEADADRNGLSNLEEFAFGHAPGKIASENILRLNASDTSHYRLTFRRAIDAEALTYDLLESSTLSAESWTLLKRNPGSNGQLVDIPLKHNVSRQYYRLQLTLVP